MEHFPLRFWRHSTVNSNYERGISYSVFPHCADDIEAKTFWLLLLLVDAFFFFFPNYCCVFYTALQSPSMQLAVLSHAKTFCEIPLSSVGCKSGGCVLVLQELQKHHWRPWRLDFPPYPNCCLPEHFPWGRISILKALLTCSLLWCLLHPSVGNCPCFRTCSESLGHLSIIKSSWLQGGDEQFADHMVGSRTHPIPKTDIRFVWPLDGGFSKWFNNVLVWNAAAVSLFSAQSLNIAAHRYCLALESLGEIHGEFIAGRFGFWKSPG